MKISLFVFNPYMENTYIYFDEVTKEAAIIDPGCFSGKEFEEIDKFIDENKLSLKFILICFIIFDETEVCIEKLILNYIYITCTNRTSVS